jgi:hypothetical protein
MINILSQRGASDIRLVITVLIIVGLFSLILSCNGWIKNMNLERRGYVEGDNLTIQQSEGGNKFVLPARK